MLLAWTVLRTTPTLSVVAVLTVFFFIVPWTTAVVLSRVNVLETWEANNRMERNTLLLFVAASTVTGAVTIAVMAAPQLVVHVAVIGAAVTVMQAVVNWYWKISFHGIAWGVFTVFTSLQHIGVGLGMSIAAFVVGYSRVWLGRHTPLQVVTGFGLGAAAAAVFLL